jgi:hypothetical protein
MMPYDFDGAVDRSPPQISAPRYEPTDLEAIVMALEIAAINLTPTTGAEFTLDQLLDEVERMDVDRAGAAIVVGNVKFLERHVDLLRLK